jgi:signal transduction histidine kinase
MITKIKTRVKTRNMTFSHISSAMVVFIAILSITVINWTTANGIIKPEQQKLAKEYNIKVIEHINKRVEAYEDILRGGVGLFKNTDEISREDWSRYVDAFDIINRYPGVQALAYVQVLQPNLLDAHQDLVRKNGFPGYTVFPGGSRDLYSSIVYIEPLDEKNKKAVGYDMLTEPVRNESMRRAIDSGDVAVSGLVTLVQDSTTDTKQPGFVMYLPVYSKGVEPSTLLERRQNIRGFMAAAFRTYDFIDTAHIEEDKNYAFQVVEGIDKSGAVIYESPQYSYLTNNPEVEPISSSLRVNQVDWQINGLLKKQALAASIIDRPLNVLWAGIALSILVSSFVYLLLANRSKTLAGEENVKLQEAKDELLALASHQLRTPATGVKQYVGMLHEGLAGELSELQKNLVAKAYESNERQLSTINEMLFVARSDNGQLKMDNSIFDICALMSDVIAEQSGVISEREQVVKSKISNTCICILGDKHYMRMALENILSNASKYTPDGGKIFVYLEKIDESKLIVSVRDTGTGVSPEDQSLLFKKFSRVPNELTSLVGGSGIGLYLAKKVVDGHGGTIELISDGEQGSEVRIILPITSQDC